MKRILAFVTVVSLVLGLLGTAVYADKKGSVSTAENPGLTVESEPGKMKIKLEGEFGEKDWIGVYKNGEKTDPDNGGIVSLVWWYVGTNGCEVELPSDSPDVFYNRPAEFILDGNIIPGDYTVMVLADDGYQLKEGYTGYDITVKSSIVEDPDADKLPSELIFFEDEETYGGFFGLKNDITDLYYDEDEKCYVAETIQSVDPYVELCIGDLIEFGDIAPLTADDAKVISIGVRFDPTAANELEFYYQTEDFPGYSEWQKVITDYSNTDGYQYVNIDLRQAPNWSGNLMNCRYDVFRSSAKDCELEIYYVGFFKTMAGAEQFGEAWLAAGGGANKPEISEEPEVLLGDVDGDGEISDWDSITFDRYLAGWSVEFVEDAMDVDGDDEISDWDAIMLARYLAGWNIQFG